MAIVTYSGLYMPLKSFLIRILIFNLSTARNTRNLPRLIYTPYFSQPVSMTFQCLSMLIFLKLFFRIQIKLWAAVFQIIRKRNDPRVGSVYYMRMGKWVIPGRAEIQKYLGPVPARKNECRSYWMVDCMNKWMDKWMLNLLLNVWMRILMNECLNDWIN